MWVRAISLVAALLAITAVGCGGGMSVAGEGPAYGGQVVPSYGGQVPAGTTVWVKLDQRISSRSRVGEPFTAHVTQDIIGSNGEMLIPRGSLVQGRVIGVQRGGGGRQASVALAMEAIDLGGVRQPLRATIVDTDVSFGKRVRTTDVLAGAAVGAVLGGVLEGGKGAVAGGALGAAAGTAISLGRGQVRPELPRGTRMALRLEQPIESFASLQQRRYY